MLAASVAAREPGTAGGATDRADCESLWAEVAGRLRGALNDTTYRTWFGEVEGIELTDDAFVSPSRTTSRASGSRGISSS